LEKKSKKPVILKSLFPGVYKVAQKSKPLPNDHKIVLNRIKAWQWYYIYSSN